jgi:RNA polymerase sigma-70 factor (TIGR02960 family)
MIDREIARAGAGDEAAFRELTDPYRRELQLHCYRMLGSMHDAEDMLQETLLSAWRGLGAFEQRASLRSWLYQIATNRCLNVLRHARRAPPPAYKFPFSAPPATRADCAAFLEPIPDDWLNGIPDDAPGPAARYDTRESVELAFIAALQDLTALQRAALVLRDVLGFRAAEAAQMLSTSEESVKGALKRGRSVIDQRAGSHASSAAPGSPEEREVVRSFVEAFADDDVDAIIELLTTDACLTMPPARLAYRGHDAIATFLRALFAWAPGRATDLVPTRANGHPAFGCYGPSGPSGLLVLSIAGPRITAIARFLNPEIQPRFGLPGVEDTAGLHS